MLAVTAPGAMQRLATAPRTTGGTSATRALSSSSVTGRGGTSRSGRCVSAAAYRGPAVLGMWRTSRQQGYWLWSGNRRDNCDSKAN